MLCSIASKNTAGLWASGRPEDLNLHRRIAVKSCGEMPTDTNARHLARLQAEDLAAFRYVFQAHEDTPAHFGYEWMA